MADKTQTGFGSGNFDQTVDSTLDTLGKPLNDLGGFSGSAYGNLLTPRAEEILHQREATFLATSQRKIAIQNIGGGLLPQFDNSNLYGFALMTFTGGWDSGWNVVDIKSVLKPPITAPLTGGDDVANISSYFFNVNPKSIAVSEPNAVHILPTQNNGFYVESQGTVLRRMSIAGTTGFRPSRSKLPSDMLLPGNPNEPTGFLNHIKLRNLFRNYSNLKKDAKKAKNTFLVWYNGLTQEAWFCEPESFTTSKDASSPFISRYEINVTLLHKVAFSAVNVKLSPGLMGEQFWLESIRLASVMMNRDNIPEWMQDVNNVVKDTAALIDGVSNGIGLLERYTSSAVAVGGMAIGVLPALAMPIMQSVKNVAFSARSLTEGSQIFANSVGDSFTKFGNLWEEFGANMQSICTSALFSSNALILDLLERRGSEVRTNIESDNKYYGDYSGAINYEVPNDDYTYIESTVPSSTDDIDTIIGNNGGFPASKPLFFWANDLKYPYISAVPSGNTVRPGDTIYIPYPNGKKIPPNIETKLFPLNIKLGLYEEILGRDIKLVSMVTGMGQKSFNLALSQTGDLDLVQSTDNMVQAIYIKLSVERGELALHPGFGMIDVIGMKSTLDLSFATNLAINDTMLSDGRIESISGLKISAIGDVMNVSLNAHIFGQRNAIPLALQVGG